jgi:hypothetical protein
MTRHWGDESLVDWVEVITRTAEARWNIRKPLFLAQIPGELRRHGVELSAILAGRTLREAISVDASHRVRLVQDPNHPLVWGLIPNSAPVETDLARLFQKPPQSENAASAQPRYKRWFFTAFIKPIPDSHRRWISIDGFDDLPQVSPAAPGTIEIERTDIVRIELGVSIDNASVHQAIRSWATRTGTNLEQYYNVTGPPKRTTVNLKSLSSLAFESLSEDDLKRILIPLDIIVKLLRR